MPKIIRFVHKLRIIIFSISLLNFYPFFFISKSRSSFESIGTLRRLHQRCLQRATRHLLISNTIPCMDRNPLAWLAPWLGTRGTIVHLVHRYSTVTLFIQLYIMFSPDTCRGGTLVRDVPKMATL